jgi:hypothetical protein
MDFWHIGLNCYQGPAVTDSQASFDALRAKSVFLSNAVDGPPLPRCGWPRDLHEVAVEVAVPFGDGLCHRCKSHFWANQTPTDQDLSPAASPWAPVPPPLSIPILLLLFYSSSLCLLAEGQPLLSQQPTFQLGPACRSSVLTLYKLSCGSCSHGG